MATYKVLQDIEAEDKLVGPLSLRQFIYAGVSAVALYVCFLAYTRGVPFLLIFFLPVAMIGAFFGFPWKGEQPTEIWALARLRFMVKPRVRIWNQSGIKDLVTVTAPKRAPVQAKTHDLSQYEVRSRLRALADTIDSRGWATRNANYQYYAAQHRPPQTDRLVNASDLQPGAIPMDAFLPSNDMLDDLNPIARSFDALLSKSDQQKRQRVQQEIAQAQAPAPIPAPAAQMAPVMQAAPAQTQAAAPPSGLQFQEVPQQQYQPPRPLQTSQPGQPGPQLPAPSLPRPVTPMTFNPASQTQQAQATPNPYWFVPQPGSPAAPQPFQSQLSPAPAAQQQQRPAAAAPAAPVISAQPLNTTPPPAPAARQAQAAPAAPAAGLPPVPTADGLPAVPAAEPTPEEQAMVQQLRAQNKETMEINYGHMRVLQTPAGSKGSGSPASYGNLPGSAGTDPAAAQQPSVTHQPDPAILDLANNNDLDVATLARQAHKGAQKSSDEVEVPLR